MEKEKLSYAVRPDANAFDEIRIEGRSGMLQEMKESFDTLQSKEGKGMRWVKLSERFPTNTEKNYAVKFSDPLDLPLGVLYYSGESSKTRWRNTVAEWLDESSDPSSEIESLRAENEELLKENVFLKMRIKELE